VHYNEAVDVSFTVHNRSERSAVKKLVCDTAQSHQRQAW
jgi:hypothetical protein